MPQWEYCVVVHQISFTSNPEDGKVVVYRRRSTLQGDDVTIIWEWSGSNSRNLPKEQLHTTLWRYIAQLGFSGWEMLSVTTEEPQVPSGEMINSFTKYYFKRQLLSDTPPSVAE